MSRLVAMPLEENRSHKLLSAALRELRRILSSFSSASPHATAATAGFTLELSDEECAALAREAIGGRAEAEFTVASLFDAAGLTSRALEWYERSASRNYLPAMLQLAAVR